MDRFIKVWRQGLSVDFIKNYSQNKENHFDFTINTTNGTKIYIDLMEIAILNKRGYNKAKNSHNVGEYTDFVIKNIMKKSDKYSSKSDIFLLLYITDDKFNLSDSILHCLAYMLNIELRHVFHLISIVELNVNDTDKVIYLSPCNDTLNHDEYLKLRKNNIINLTDFHLSTSY